MEMSDQLHAPAALPPWKEAGYAEVENTKLFEIYLQYDRCSRVRFPAGAGNFSLHRRFQNGSGAHPASYLMGTRGSFHGGKEAGA
jgi:hypothetical protein